MLWLGLRGVVLLNAALLLLHIALPSSTPSLLVVAGAVGCILSEVLGAYARRARTHGELERRVLGAAFAVACASFCVMRTYGGGVGLFAFVLLLAAYAPVLRGRSMLFLAGVASGLVAVDLVLGSPGREPWMLGFPPQYGQGARAVVLFFEVSVMAHLATRRLTRANTHVQALVSDLQVAQERLSNSNRRLERWNDDLNREVQRQTVEIASRAGRATALNAVSIALSEAVRDDASFDSALMLLGRMFDACAVHVYGGASAGEKPTLQRVRLHGHVDLDLPKAVLLEVSDGLVARQSWRMSFADQDGNAILCQFGVVPIMSRGRVRGALAVCREGEWAQHDEDLGLLATIGRELGAAIDHRREFREALARASRESLLNSVAAVLDATPDTRTAFRRALRDVGLWTGASELAVVVRNADSHQYEILARFGARGMPDLPVPEGLRRLLLSIPAMVADRTEPLLLGSRGELLVPDDMASLAIGSLLVAPIVAHREPIGVVALIGDGDHQWGVPQREVAARLSHQLAARLEADEVVRLQARRISELSGLARIAEVVQSSVDPARLFRGFARATAEVVPFARMYVARYDMPDGRLLVEQYDQNGSATACVSSSDDATHPWLSVRTATQMSPRDGKAPTFLADVWSPIVVPMRPKAELIGAIVIEPTEQFESEQLTVLAQAVSQLALALDSAELYRQATERAARIQVIGNLSRIVASVVDLRDAFEAFTEEVRWLIPFDRAVMFRLDGAAGVVEPYAACPSEGFVPQAASDLVSSLAWRAYLEHKPVLIRRADLDALGRDWSAFDDASEVAMVPVLRGDECIAMLALAHGGDDRYTQSDIDALQEVGQLLAVGIERVELFQRAEHSARHDMLTGLPNARYLQEQMDALQPGDTCALLMLDMDNLKMFNDTLGHAIGDEAIRVVGETVLGAVRGGDFVARLGGDEFVVLMRDAGMDGAQALAARIHEQLGEAEARVENAPSDIHVSIGLATMPADAATTDEMLHAADVAMYAAKFAGGGRTALASGSTVHRLTRNYRRRPERLMDNIVHAATAAAAPREREAIALAQRYALATAGRLGLPGHESEVLRMLVAEQAIDRLKDAQSGLDQTLAYTILEGFAKDWAGRDAQAAALGEAVAEIALSLAWLQLPEPFGADLELSEAAGRLSETRGAALDATILQAMQAALREQPTEGLRSRAA